MEDGFKILRVWIPTFEELWSALPETEQTEPLRTALWEAYETERQIMLSNALAPDCRQPQVTMNRWRQAGRQHISEFAVSDLALPYAPDCINLHGHNASQWRYAGAIVVEDGHVSRHH